MASFWYCEDCHEELYRGKIPPAWGPLEAETPDHDDDLVVLGCRDNAVRAMEEDR